MIRKPKDPLRDNRQFFETIVIIIIAGGGAYLIFRLIGIICSNL